MRKIILNKKIIFLIIILSLMNKVFSKNSGNLSFESQTLSKDATNYLLYSRAKLEHLSGNPTDLKKAAFDFEQLVDREKSKFSYEGYIKLLDTLNENEKIIKLYENEEVKKKFTNNPVIQLIFAQAFLNLNKEEEANKIFDELIKKFPDNKQIAYFRALGLIKNKKFDSALAFIKECLNNSALKSSHFIFLFLEAKIYLNKNQYSLALDAMKKCLRLYPDFEKGWLLKAFLEEQLGRVNDAIAGYKKFLDIAGDDLEVERQLIRLLFLQQRYGEAEKLLKKRKEESFKYYFDLALLEFKAKKFDSAFNAIEKVIQKAPKFKQARLLKIDILFAQNRKKDVLSFVQDWLTNDPSDRSIIIILMLLRRSGISLASIYDVLDKAISTSGGNVELYSAIIDLCFDQKNYKKVLFYSKKLFELSNDLGLKSKILFLTAYIHFILGDRAKSKRALLTAMKYEPIYPSVLNLYSYLCALENNELDKALEYINMALKSEPSCYYYLDTKGFVLLKLGKTNEAISFFEEALRLNPHDKEVIKHLKVAKSLLNKNVETK